MTEYQDVPDAAERLRAIDPAFSFIVQAPAGSGKTGLLIQRYLRLLTCVSEPEEIVAITFTRKAAAEMRERIVLALDAAAAGAASPENAFDKLTGKLAAAVTAHDQRFGWNLILNPMRLRIQTIDALCASLTRQMPVLSKFGSQPEISENVQGLYRDAARATIALLDQGLDMANDIAMVLEHLDNDIARVENLLAAMLARRDHWLRHIHGKTREELEASLRNMRSSAVNQLCSLLPSEVHQELLALVRYAAANLLAEQKTSVLVACDGLDKLPDNIDQWGGIAELLLKTDGEWRDRVDVRQGFPAGKSKSEKETARAWKTRLSQLIEKFKTNQPLQRLLNNSRHLPSPAYSETQWKILGAITRLLPHAVAQLKIMFQLAGQVDFSEVMQCALVALGEPENPTDLSLALDYRIKHVLIDEFQDTSISQYQLVEKLVAEWEPGDGRSLFAVGDPMQSIYRFREAEVGLFLRARQTGVGHIALQPITLKSNFRSQRGLVDWVNTSFRQIMPVNEDVAVGAVAYAPSIAMHDELDGPAVTVHPAFEKDRAAEAEKVVDVIAQSRQQNPQHSIAVLVRNRSHLVGIVACLQSVGLRFRAVEIDALDQKPMVQDLLMLARALQDPADQLAWLAVLRAPWCGLLLNDLQTLVSFQTGHPIDQSDRKPQTILELINEKSVRQKLSCDGSDRLHTIGELLTQCVSNRYRQSLRTTVEAAWQALGGPGCVEIQNKTITQPDNPGVYYEQDRPVTGSVQDAMIFLDYLEACEQAGNVSDWADFEGGLAKLFAAADFEADNGLQIMTIHKAKGLEFDTVLVPGLGHPSRNRDKHLLRWMEQPRQLSRSAAGQYVFNANETDLFLAPIQEAGQDNDTINLWLESLEREKENYEAERLLYVAATRARKYLHLFGHAGLKDQNGESVLQEPKSGSLLNRLWPAVEQIYADAAMQNQMQESNRLIKAQELKKTAVFDQSVLRLESGWQLPKAPEPVNWQVTEKVVDAGDTIEFSWAGETAKQVGSVVHRWLQRIADDKLQGWDARRIQSMRRKFADTLLMHGLSAEKEALEQAVVRVVTALINSITDQRGRWILGEQSGAQNELRLTSVNDGQIAEYVIDRTFYDDHGIRWVIDYKTSSHEGSGLAVFLDREQERYAHQLNYYAALLQKIDKRPVCMGLYFPMLKGWRAWKYRGENV
ncbi:ATP-dependent exoDNAse (exonuclease V) beta subunit (contains helicase and exonuclease domains) [Nitrosomonas sp. Nm51]|uniref:UvrD-helicase domain-containing protein n=1 Tax=Nitrosomonas sp. Nm51 TaxID=133720 RepID=UPI0008B3AB57|nr:UvrD-helicase domain-containing protein [Nitrosomonas sp. Nm51]SER41484.1 ATP-dependent exoDNAse (exonuclease V) beta subunit (contains helicase and exonuclease domains) [Nitrosomonas sp. Nm51]